MHRYEWSAWAPYRVPTRGRCRVVRLAGVGGVSLGRRRQSDRWCTQRGIPALPGNCEALCVYLTERVAQGGRATSSLGVTCEAIRYVPTSIKVSRTRPPLRSSNRLQRTASHLRHRVTPTGPTTRHQRHPGDRVWHRPSHAKGVRDTALVLIGFASAMRRSELAALTLASRTLLTGSANEVGLKIIGEVLDHLSHQQTAEGVVLGHGNAVAVADLDRPDLARLDAT